MSSLTDKNIEAVEEIPTPRELQRELPLNPGQEASICRFR